MGNGWAAGRCSFQRGFWITARHSAPLFGIATAVALASEPVLASGYGLREQSASAMGNAFAGGAAGADDLTYMYFNPASLTRQSGSQIAVGGSLILPHLRFHDAEATTAGGVPVGGNNGGQNAGEDALVPFVYAMWDVQQSFDLRQNVKAGVGVNVPFGVETDYRDGWKGRYHALQSKVRSVNVNPVVAWEVADGLSVAAGLQLQYFSARLTNAVDFGSIGQAVGGTPTRNDGRARVSGDDVGYGFDFGLLYEPWTGTRFGAAYRSAVHHTLDGDVDFTLDGQIGQNVAQVTRAFRDTGVRSNVTTPEIVTFGFYQQLAPEWEMMGSAEWTRWSRFRDLTIKYDNANQPNTVTENDWQDTWFLSLGLTWHPDPSWRLRGGVAWDQDPSTDRLRTPRIPTDDRYWLAIGAGWSPMANLTLDLAYTHIFLNDAAFNLDAGEPGNRYRGSLSGSGEGSVDVLALQARWTF